MSYYGNLKVPQQVYEQRRDRLSRMVAEGCPPIIIGFAARLVAECFSYGLGHRFHRWRMEGRPGWAVWLSGWLRGRLAGGRAANLDERSAAAAWIAALIRRSPPE
jgi:hypothetical protein